MAAQAQGRVRDGIRQGAGGVLDEREWHFGAVGLIPCGMFNQTKGALQMRRQVRAGIQICGHYRSIRSAVALSLEGSG